MDRVIVCPIAYNEYPKLQTVLDRILIAQKKFPMDCVVVNDGSSDKTPSLLKRYEKKGVKHITHPTRKGVGAAIRSAIAYARQENYQILVVMAGNNKDNPEEIRLLVEALEGYDIAQGSRYRGKNQSHGKFPFHRQIATRLHPLLMSMFLRRRLTDTTNGFRAIRVKLFDDSRINLNQSWLDSYELEPYILYRAIALGYAVTEVPVTKVYPSGKNFTKMKPFTGWWSIIRPILYLGFGIKS